MIQGMNVRVTGNRVAQQQKFALPDCIGIALIGEGHAVDLTDNSISGFATGIDVSCPTSGLVVSRNVIEVTSAAMSAVTVGSGSQVVSEVVIENNVARNGGIVNLGSNVDHRTVVLRNNVFFGARGSDVPCVNTTSTIALLAETGNVCVQ